MARALAETSGAGMARPLVADGEPGFAGRSWGTRMIDAASGNTLVERLLVAGCDHPRLSGYGLEDPDHDAPCRGRDLSRVACGRLPTCHWRLYPEAAHRRAARIAVAR